MTPLARLYRRLPWLHLPAGILIALLQRTPVLKVTAAAADRVAISPVGQLLRAAFTAATLGAMHSRAGATTFVISPSRNINGTVGTRIDVAFTYTGTPSAPQFFNVSGTLPPGLAYSPAPTFGAVRSATPTISGIPTQAGTFTIRVQGVGTGGQGPQETINFTITGGAAVAPTISTQPQGQTVLAGTSVTFTVAANGSPPLTYQWRRNGTAIAGATAATFTLPSAQVADAGAYTVVVTNAASSVTSAAANLVVNAGGGVGSPTISLQPLPVAAANGSTVALTVVATGTPAPTYQWRKDGVNVAGATNATLILPGVTAGSAGSYSVVVANNAGTVTSNSVAVTVGAGTSRLANLSVRANLAAAQTLFVGFTTNGTKNVLLRGIGPTLGAFGVGGAYPDPRLEVYDGSTKVTENDDWNATLAPVFSSVGAFGLTVGGKDAALQAPISGARTAQLSGTGSGVVLVEVYDSGTGTAVRLVNVSARNFVGTGDNILIAGFVIDGSVGKTLLIRAIGPRLADLGVQGVLADPKLEIYSGTTKIAENDNWSATLALTAQSVGAFSLNTGSADAALLVTLPPGAYSAQVSGIASGTGEALVEVYEVP
jgi:hypothetical protein